MLSRPILTRMQIFPASTVLETTWYKILVRNKNSNVYKKWIKKNKYKKYSIQCKKMCKHKQNAKLNACLFGTFFQLQSLRTFDALPPQAHTAHTFCNFFEFPTPRHKSILMRPVTQVPSSAPRLTQILQVQVCRIPTIIKIGITKESLAMSTHQYISTPWFTYIT